MIIDEDGVMWMDWRIIWKDGWCDSRYVVYDNKVVFDANADEKEQEQP